MSHSTTHWVRQLQTGDQRAAQELWERYYRRLVDLARKKLGGRGARGAVDEDDIAQSAFAAFCRAAEQGRFPQLVDRNDLWRLLIVITRRKISHQLRHENCRKRRVVHLDPIDRVDPIDLDEIATKEPTPDFCVAALESFRELLTQLSHPTLQSLALMKMEGYTNDEIAHWLNCSVSTVERKLRRIRHEWSDVLERVEEISP